MKKPSQDFRTLFVMRDASVEAMLRILGAEGEVASEGDLHRVAFPDGGRATFTFSPRGPGGDKVSFTLLGAATHFRKKRLEGNAEARRDRILARVQKGRGLIGSLSESAFSERALATVMRLADMFDALVFDGDTLSDSTQRLLLTTKGYVADDIPATWQLSVPPPRRRRGQVK